MENARKFFIVVEVLPPSVLPRSHVHVPDFVLCGERVGGGAFQRNGIFRWFMLYHLHQ